MARPDDLPPDVAALVARGMEQSLPGPQLVVAQPINDQQVILLMGALLCNSGHAPEVAMQMAFTLFAEWVVQMQQGAIPQAIEAAKRKHALAGAAGMGA